MSAKERVLNDTKNSKNSMNSKQAQLQKLFILSQGPQSKWFEVIKIGGCLEVPKSLESERPSMC